jgi:O-antigen/teichoic acid export membrane protein
MNIALSAFTPVFARLQKEQERLSGVYFTMLELTMSVVAPMFLGLMVTAPLIVPMILGQSWAGAVPTAQWVCIGLTVHAIYYFSSALTMGTGKAKATFLLMAMQAPGVLAASALGAAYGGAEAVAMGQAMVSVATIVPYYLLVTRRVLGPCFVRFVASFSIPMALAAVMALTVTLFGKAAGVANPYLALALQVAVGALVYCALLIAFRPAVVREIVPLIMTRRAEAPPTPA